jgi:hypothetical protein
MSILPYQVIRDRVFMKKCGHSDCEHDHSGSYTSTARNTQTGVEWSRAWTPPSCGQCNASYRAVGWKIPSNMSSRSQEIFQENLQRWSPQ